MAAVSGTVRDSNGDYAQRWVRVYRRDSGVLVGASLSNATTGAWSVTTADAAEHFAIVHDSSSVGDPYFSSVVLLLHGDGTNGSTTVSDSSLSAKTVTVYGGAAISTAQSKFGGSSLYLDGAGDYIGVAPHADFAFGTGDFTVECWVRVTTLAQEHTVVEMRPATTNGAYGTIAIPTDGSILYAANSGVRIQSAASAISTNTWYHVAVARSGTSTKMFLGGTQVSSTWTDSLDYATTGLVAGRNAFSSALDMTGYIDDLRVTKGVARYTAAFTPPVAALPGALSGGSGNALIFDRLVPA